MWLKPLHQIGDREKPDSSKGNANHRVVQARTVRSAHVIMIKLSAY